MEASKKCVRFIIQTGNLMMDQKRSAAVERELARVEAGTQTGQCKPELRDEDFDLRFKPPIREPKDWE